MLLVLTIDSVDRTSFIVKGSFSRSNKLNSRDTLSFSVIDTTGTFVPEEGLSVSVTLDGVTEFAGKINDITEVNLPGTDVLMYQVSCVDYNELCDRITVADNYEDQDLETIVTSIVTDYLSDDGVTTTNVETDTPTITKIVNPQIPVSQVFDDLCDLTGYAWYIDYDKDLHFFSRSANLASTDLDDDNMVSLEKETTISDYRNVQYIDGGMAETSVTQVDTFLGDGETTSFSCKFPLAHEPTITVNSVGKTVGIGGVQEGYDWYWNKNERTVYQDSGGVKLTSSDTLSVSYIGFYKIKVKVDAGGEITSRQAVEGGSGVYEAIESDSTIETVDAAIEKANGLLRRYGSIPVKLDIQTLESGFRAGQLVTVESTKHSISGQYLINSVDIKEIGKDSYVYKIEALSGERIGGWIDFFKRMVQKGRTFVIRENEVLVRCQQFTESMEFTESFSTSSAAPESRVGYAIVGYSEVGSEVSAITYVIDTITPTPVAAYGLRRLTSSYLGSIIRVRRDSDDTEQDIGYSGEDLDTSALLSFVGAGNGYIVTWYDQSGNGYNATQSTQARQPRIVNSGAVESDGALFNDTPCLTLSTSSGLIRNVSGASIVACLSYLALPSGEENALYISRGDTGWSSRIQFGGLNSKYSISGRRLDSDSWQYEQSAGNVSLSTKLIQTAIIDYANSDADCYVDGVNVINESNYQTDGNTSDTDPVESVIGAAAISPRDFFNGYISEILVYESALNSADQSDLEDNMTDYYI